MKKLLLTSAFIVCTFLYGSAQTVQKNIYRQDQTWLGLIGYFAINKKWAIVSDIHIKRINFLSDPGFYLVRSGLTYNVNKQFGITIGYAHMWTAPATSGWKTFTDENRMYEQLQLNSKLNRVSLLHRLRNEQRWQSKIVYDHATGDNIFTNRIRYLLNITVPVFKDNHLPALVLADEVFLQFGKEVVYNTFQQNRIYTGIKQRLSKDLSVDIGYMFVSQQRASGFQYDYANTLRCYINYSPDLHKKETAVSAD